MQARVSDHKESINTWELRASMKARVNILCLWIELGVITPFSVHPTASITSQGAFDEERGASSVPVACVNALRVMAPRTGSWIPNPRPGGSWATCAGKGRAGLGADAPPGQGLLDQHRAC